MADRPNTATRRAILGAAIALPALCAAPALSAKLAAPTASLFDVRLAAFKLANAHFLRICNDDNSTDDEGEAACHTAGRAYDDLIATPAPDFRATTEKLAALCVWSKGCRIEEHEVLMICADAERVLAAGEVA